MVLGIHDALCCAVQGLMNLHADLNHVCVDVRNIGFSRTHCRPIQTATSEKMLSFMDVHIQIHIPITAIVIPRERDGHTKVNLFSFSRHRAVVVNGYTHDILFAHHADMLWVAVVVAVYRRQACDIALCQFVVGGEERLDVFPFFDLLAEVFANDCRIYLLVFIVSTIVNSTMPIELIELVVDYLEFLEDMLWHIVTFVCEDCVAFSEQLFGGFHVVWVED